MTNLRHEPNRPERDTRSKRGQPVATRRTPDQVLADALGKFKHDPLGYVMFCFPWDVEVSIQIVRLADGVEEVLTKEDRARRDEYRARFPHCKYGPDLWVCDFLDQVGAETLRRKFDGRTPVSPLYFATVSGHEIGKSALVAWLTKWILDTRPHSKGSLTAVTDEQLRTKTWAEVGKWHNMSLTRHWYDLSSSRGNMSLIHREHPQWRADARTARKERSESFAGQHSPSATSFYIFDEASGIESNIFVVREGGLTSGEPMVFDFGNGTQNSGAFFDECTGVLKGANGQNRFIVRAIDSRHVAITNKEKIESDRQVWGEDSDRFRVRWRGLFPDRGHSQFIPTDWVDACMERDDFQGPNRAPLILGVDVARKGRDDSVIWPRRGLDARSFEPEIVDDFKTDVLLGRIVATFNRFAHLGTLPTMIFVDEGNTGGAVVDFLVKLGYPAVGIPFGSRPTDKVNYRFKSDEMWGTMRDAVEHGLILPRRNSTYGDRIHAELTQREYGFMMGTDRLHLETKDDMKARGVQSPDFADALCVGYGQEVADLSGLGIPSRGGDNTGDLEYDPFATALGG